MRPPSDIQGRPILVESVAENDALDDRTGAVDLCDRLAQDFDTHLLLLSNDAPKDGGRRNTFLFWKDDPKLAGELEFLLDGLRPDIVHTHRMDELATLGRAAGKAGVPHIVHSLCREIAGARNWHSDEFAAIAERLSPLLIAPNEEAAGKLPSWARIEILRTGVDCERYVPGDKTRARRKVGLPKAPRIIGCASPAHGMAPLLETVFHMGEEVHLALFGNGRPGNPERALIKRLNMEERVHVLGAWARPETIFQAIDVYFHGPSGNSLPRPVLAAQACGKPAIACVPALSDALCPQTGRLAPLQFMPTLRHSLRCALDSAAPEVTRQFIVDNWNVEQSLEGYGALFKRLTERTCPNRERT